MRRLAFVIALLLTSSAVAQNDAKTAFEKIKALEGEWVGTYKGPEGSIKTAASVRVVSRGSAVMLVTDPGGPEEMITMFHPDNSRLMATHYCGAKNQPRMELVPSADLNTLQFRFKDATNLASPDVGHMVALTLAVPDANHHTERWTYMDHGKEDVAIMEMARMSHSATVAEGPDKPK